MSKILALWATPRSTSTAFETVMKNRGDMTCFHEPYNEAFYCGVEFRHNRYFDADPDLKPIPGLTIRSVHEKLTSLSENKQVFVKDFAYSISHMADDQFLDAFTHSFLIRDPEKVITSMHARWPDISLAEIGFEDLYTLFKRVADFTGEVPPVINSDALLASPESGMAAYCNTVKIPFLADSLKWEDQKKQHEKNNPTWNTDEHGFHDSLKASTELKPQKRNYPPLESSADMMRLYEACLPHYQAMCEFSIDIDRTGIEATA